MELTQSSMRGSGTSEVSPSDAMNCSTRLVTTCLLCRCAAHAITPKARQHLNPVGAGRMASGCVLVTITERTHGDEDGGIEGVVVLDAPALRLEPAPTQRYHYSGPELAIGKFGASERVRTASKSDASSSWNRE